VLFIISESEKKREDSEGQSSPRLSRRKGDEPEKTSLLLPQEGEVRRQQKQEPMCEQGYEGRAARTLSHSGRPLKKRKRERQPRGNGSQEENKHVRQWNSRRPNLHPLLEENPTGQPVKGKKKKKNWARGNGGHVGVVQNDRGDLGHRRGRRYPS